MFRAPWRSLNGGNALASVLAAPLGSFLGAFVGWRWAFFSVVPVAAIVLVWKCDRHAVHESRAQIRLGKCLHAV